MKRMCATRVYKNFFKLLDNISAVGAIEVIRNGDKGGCYILSKEKYEGMIETMQIMKNCELYDRILRARADSEVTRHKSANDLLKKVEKSCGTKVRNQGPQKHGKGSEQIVEQQA